MKELVILNEDGDKRVLTLEKENTYYLLTIGNIITNTVCLNEDQLQELYYHLKESFG